MDSGSGKSTVSRLIDWIRGKGNSSSSPSATSSGKADRPGTSGTTSASSPGANATPAGDVTASTPAAPAETTPAHLPSEQASVPPNAASLDLDATPDSTGPAPAPSSSEGKPATPTPPDPVPATQTSNTSEPAAAAASTTASTTTTSGTAASTQPPASPEPKPADDAPTTVSDLPDLGNTQDNARRANYGRGNVEVGAKGSVGSPTSGTPEFTLTGDEEANAAGIEGDATAQDNTDLDATELGALEDTEPTASETGLDPAPEQPAGLSAADLVAGASTNLTSAQQTLSSDSTTGTESESATLAGTGLGEAATSGESGTASSTEPSGESATSTADNLGSTDTTDTELSLLTETDASAAAPAAAFAAGLAASDTASDAPEDASTAGSAASSETNEQYSRADAFDSVDSTGIFGLADQDSTNLVYLDEASRESFDSTVDELPESTGLFGLRDTSATDLDYLSDSETDRYNFDAVTTSDVATGEDFDAGASSPISEPTSSILTDQPSGGTAAASESAPDSAAILNEAAAAPPLDTPAPDDEPEPAAQPGGGPSASDQPTGDDASVGVTTPTADPESLLAPADASPDSVESDELAAPPPSRTAAASGSGPSTTPASETGGRVKGVDGVCPPDFPIKGNASSKVYHVPGLPSYEKTKAEWCFPSEDDAISFGYRAPGGHRNQAAARTGGSTTAPTGLQHITPTETPADTIAAVEPPLDSPAPDDQPPTTPAQHSDSDVDTATEQAEPSTPQGAVAGDGTPTCPVDFPIKGNGGSMIYHVPGTAAYDATIPEWCFATEDDARGAGFRAPRRR